MFRWQPTLVISLLMVAVGAFMALRGRGLFFRGAWVTFVVQHLLFMVPIVAARAQALGLFKVLIVVFALLLVAAGVTKRGPKVLVAVVVVFIVVAAGRIVMLTYADRLLGNRSVVGLLTGA